MCINMTSDICIGDGVAHGAGGADIISFERTVSCGTMRGSATVGNGAELGRKLQVAARAGDTATVLDLMAKGTPFTTDWLGTSPLHLAAANAHVDTCAVLLRAGVSRDARTKVDRTPLHMAAYGGHGDAVSLLVEQGALVDCRDMLRMTPLHWAAQRGHVAVAQVLLRHGADPAAVSKFGATPLTLAGRGPAETRVALTRLLEEAARAREAARSVRALVTSATELDECNSIKQIKLEPLVEKPNNITSTPTITNISSCIKTEQTTPGKKVEKESEDVGAQLLRRHGITLLPADEGTTVLNALQSGRSIVLSDAGKLMLKESGAKPVLSKSTSNTGSRGVVLTATPVRSTPRGPLKIFTLNNKLLLPPGDNKNKKIIHPQNLQVKYVARVPGVGTGRVQSRRTPPASTTGEGTPIAPAPVKIILNRANFTKFLSPLNTNSTSGSSSSASTQSEASVVGSSGSSPGPTEGSVFTQAEAVLRVSEDWVSHCSQKQLRAHVLQARHALAALLRHCRATHTSP